MMDQVLDYVNWWFDGSIEALILAAIALYAAWKILVWVLPDWMCGPGGIWIDTSIGWTGDRGDGCGSTDAGGDGGD